ncbi:MAG: coproporphyrinogen dehydrogenase HemZ [Clostridia bacterium]|nr:coproporphyrinogen dehydrogenase HemZ [Clostridia bacterium]
MYDKHELIQVVNEFGAVYENALETAFNDKNENGVYSFNVSINGKGYGFTHNINEKDLKQQIKFFTKNDVYDALKDYTGLTVPWGSYTGVRPVSTAVKLINELGEKNAEQALINDFRMSDEKARLCIEIAKKQLPLLNGEQTNIDVYISIPFCVSRCSYCSFSLVGIEGKKKLQPFYTDALCDEINTVGNAVLQNGYKVRSVYIGGGTPTALSPNLLDRVLNTAATVFKNPKEFTLEAGRADTITDEILGAVSKYPITRFNINPQTMVDETLKNVGRRHTADDVERAFLLARKYGLDNINMDLIAGLPQETEKHFQYTLNKVLDFSPEGITVHTLALKRASSLKKQDYKIRAINSINEMLCYAYKRLEQAEYLPYYLYRQKNMEGNGENVGFCKNGNECLYNIDIMEENTHILAFGSGAVSKRINKDGLVRRSDPKDIEVYLDRIEDTKKKGIEFFVK